MTQLIFEIGCEEIPARFMRPALDQLLSDFQTACADARINISGARTLGTPRRLTLLVDHIAATQTDLEEERTGPPVRAAYRDGEPTKAALGFARGQGVDVADLYTVETERGEYVAARVFEAGAPSAELLPGILEGLIPKLDFKKSMRWARGRETFARPVRWIVAVLGGATLPVTFAGVSSANQTYGHRFAAPGAIEVTTIASYLEGLDTAVVTPDPADRRTQIAALLEERAAEAGGVLRDDPALLDEVTFLVERPHAVLVRFDEAYLELPDEVLISSMRSHQRYFSVLDANGALLPACVVIYNTPVRDPAVVRAGNLRVLKARLDDARFFWDQDLKTPLEGHGQRLERVVWLDKLGSMAERGERMAEIAAGIARLLELDVTQVDAAARASRLSKADLVTAMVGEFGDLQGVIGAAYAELGGEGDVVAQAVREQYLPKGASDALPDSDVGACVALAERLDALVGIFGVGLVPKSNSDPYGLRRASLGVLRILQGRAYNVPVSTLLGIAYDAYATQDKLGALTQERAALLDQVHGFITTRLRGLLTQDASVDVVDAVLAVASDDVLSVGDRVAALATVRSQDGFDDLATGFKRVVNMLRKQADADVAIPDAVDAELLVDPMERALWGAFLEAEPVVKDALETRDWVRACQTLQTLRAPIGAFFDEGPMILAPEENLRANRLALLGVLRGLFLRVADISRVQV